MYNVLYIHFLKLYFGTYVMGTLKKLDFFQSTKINVLDCICL